MPRAWESRWKDLGRLASGGQGLTYRVVASDGTSGVLKELKNNKDGQARARMRQEVASLQLLAAVNAKVPRVLETNTDLANDPTFPTLYVVTEFVDGETLEAHVIRTGGVSIDVATAIIDDISAVVEIAHKNDLLHRDLHPRNVIVRAVDPADAVIIDFGLSFNRADPGPGLTETSETFKNRFLDVPANVVVGGDRRDARSDVLALCALLHYAMTGIEPRHLHDNSGKLPHQRPGGTLRDRFGGDGRAAAFETLFSRGFAVAVENRFQTVEEFRERLQRAHSSSAAVRDPLAVAREGTERLDRLDKKTRLARFATKVQEPLNALATYVHEHEEKFGNFAIFNGPGIGDALPSQLESLGPNFAVGVRILEHEQHRYISYRYGCRGNQVVALRRAYRHDPGSGVFTPNGEWKEVEWFEGDSGPAQGVMIEDLKLALCDTFDEMIAEVEKLNDGT